MKADKPSVETLATVNELLKGASTIGAYALGMICAEAWRCGEQPTRALLEAVVVCPSIEQAQELISTFLELLAETET
ncbi:MAG: hypothetical protein ACRD9L_15190 [Bryobacteraceae bacterium]